MTIANRAKITDHDAKTVVLWQDHKERLEKSEGMVFNL